MQKVFSPLNFKQHLLHFYRLTYDFYINKFLKNFYSNFTSPTLFKYVIMNSFSCYDFFLLTSIPFNHFLAL